MGHFVKRAAFLRSVHFPRHLLRTVSTIRPGPVETAIKKKLEDALMPVVLEVRNESNAHKVRKGSESHFKVIVVSKKFDKLPLVKRHRLVNAALDEELKMGIHALSIVAKTPSQWEESGHVIPKSPPCKGGSIL
ncbi:hypothetical protein ScPMuIL_004381 [Solemya velum]